MMELNAMIQDVNDTQLLILIIPTYILPFSLCRSRRI